MENLKKINDIEEIKKNSSKNLFQIISCEFLNTEQTDISDAV